MGLTINLVKSVINGSSAEVKWELCRRLHQAGFPLTMIHSWQPDPAKRMAKNLGTAASCANVRSVCYNDKRHESSKALAKKAACMGRWGVSRYLTARLAVVTMQTWGLEQQGVADSMLHRMRVSTLNGAAARA